MADKLFSCAPYEAPISGGSFEVVSVESGIEVCPLCGRMFKPKHPTKTYKEDGKRITLAPVCAECTAVIKEKEARGEITVEHQGGDGE